MKFKNYSGLQCVDAFLRLYGPALAEKFDASKTSLGASSDASEVGNYDTILLLPLKEEENEYNDIVVRLSNRIYISEKHVGMLGFSNPELFAILSHELGHILFRTHPWAFDAEERADTLAADLGLGSQMISAIEKIIESRRFRHLTSALVQRIHFLQHLARS